MAILALSAILDFSCFSGSETEKSEKRDFWVPKVVLIEGTLEGPIFTFFTFEHLKKAILGQKRVFLGAGFGKSFFRARTSFVQELVLSHFWTLFFTFFVIFLIFDMFRTVLHPVRCSFLGHFHEFVTDLSGFFMIFMVLMSDLMAQNRAIMSF